MIALGVVPTGVANLASVAAAFARLGAPLVRCRSAAEVGDAAALVLPGVGHFGAAMQALQRDGLLAALRQRLAAGRPTLGICLGMQLCCAGSDEAPAALGLGLVPARLCAFAAGVRAPQMGWNRIAAAADARLLRSGAAYFANSYRLAAAPGGWSAATAEHGGSFVAGLERGAVLLCQFHPELSGEFGSALLQRWLDAATAAVTPC